MDIRKVLDTGTILSFPGMECTIDSYIGCGSNALVYSGSYPDAQISELRHHILIKELFPYHPDGAIFRSGNNEICWSSDAEYTMEIHRLSFNRGNEVHLKLLHDHPDAIDPNINTFFLNNTLYSVLGFSGGRSMDKELNSPHSEDISLTVHIHRILGVLNVLEAFHESGYLHLDISPDNILLIGDGKRERVSLIDYNSVHTSKEIRSEKSVYYSAKEGYTAPELRAGKTTDIGVAADIYAITAVFYRCLTGKTLSVMQTVRGTVPDISGAKCLEGMPDTVLNMVKKILKRGLASLVSRRYKNVTQMQLDFEELKDRIEEKGITHWALWETGRLTAMRAINTNPALYYIKDEEKLYPITGEKENGDAVSVGQIWKEMVSVSGTSVFLLGSGGAGKTTALFRAAYLQNKTYTGMDPAVIYISLYGWRECDPFFIRNHILENLRFKPETDSMETARHELMCLLSAPLYTRSGECPKLVILLDGLNEVSGNTKLLLKEIMELSEMPGVRILLTGRNEMSGISFAKIYLRPLKESEVKEALSGYGIVPPEKKEIFEMLRTPMMLSIFIEAVLNKKKQLSIDSRENLMESYFSAILEKEARKLSEESEERWQIEAAIYYILPGIARLIHIKERAVSDKDILPVVEKCYKRLKRRIIFKIFPQWIGHIADIKGSARNAEEWYGRIIHDILWRKLGFLVRDEQGNYRVVHQMVEEYLIDIERGINDNFKYRERVNAGIMIFLGLAVLAASYKWIYIPCYAYITAQTKNYYDEALSDNVLSSAFAAYMSASLQYERISDLLECLSDDTVDEDDYERKLQRCKSSLETDIYAGSALALEYIDPLQSSGDAMPWSGQPLNEESYNALITISEERSESYMDYLRILETARADEKLWDYYGADYLTKLKDIITIDAYVLGRYYQDVVAPELNVLSTSDSEEDIQAYEIYITDLALIDRQNEITKDVDEPLMYYQGLKREYERNFAQNGLLKKIKS